MRRYRQKHGRGDGMVSAAEIAEFVYCRESWRLRYGLGLEPGNPQALDAGERHHAGKAAAERVAGGAIGLGRWLVVLAALALLLAWVFSR